MWEVIAESFAQKKTVLYSNYTCAFGAKFRSIPTVHNKKLKAQRVQK